jgi:hypothetical protein
MLPPSYWAIASSDKSTPPQASSIAVGPQYDTTHVYVAPAKFDSFVNAFIAIFGGKPSKRMVGNVLPVASRAEMQYLLTPVGGPIHLCV